MAFQTSFSLPECKTGLGEEDEDCWQMLTLKAKKERQTDLFRRESHQDSVKTALSSMEFSV